MKYYTKNLLALGVFFLPAAFATLAEASSTVTVSVYSCNDSERTVKVYIGGKFQGNLSKGESEDYSCDTHCKFEFDAGAGNMSHNASSGTVYLHAKGNKDISISTSGDNCGSEG